MKLYFSPGACSLAPHIVLEEAGAQFQLIKVDLKNKTLESGENFLKINPKGQVPTLQMQDGQILTENAIINQYIADQFPQKNLLPKAGTMERYRADEWLNYVATEIHKGMGILFAVDRLVQNETGKKEFRDNTVVGLGRKFDYLSEKIQNNQFLMGSQFTPADAYLFTVLNWHGWLKVEMTKWPALMGYMERVKSRPAVQKAMKNEGIL
jgi:glutathione S-transferase